MQEQLPRSHIPSDAQETQVSREAGAESDEIVQVCFFSKTVPDHPTNCYLLLFTHSMATGICVLYSFNRLNSANNSLSDVFKIRLILII